MPILSRYLRMGAVVPADEEGWRDSASHVSIEALGKASRLSKRAVDVAALAKRKAAM